MPELTGSLSNFDVATLLRFLCGLGKSGDVLVSRGHWIGQLAVDGGRLIGAAADADTGLPALEFIAAAMTSGDFEFSEGPPTVAANLQSEPDALGALERLMSGPAAIRIGRLPGPAAV